MMGHVRKGEARKVFVISGCLSGAGERYNEFQWIKEPAKHATRKQA